MSLKKTLAKLDDLYGATGVDWDLTIHHSLTEPTCPSVAINPEGMNLNRFRVDADSIEEGIETAVQMVFEQVILGLPGQSSAPWTNSDDAKWYEWLAKARTRAKGVGK